MCFRSASNNIAYQKIEAILQDENWTTWIVTSDLKPGSSIKINSLHFILFLEFISCYWVMSMTSASINQCAIWKQTHGSKMGHVNVSVN